MAKFLGTDINYYARVNFTSLVTMVDALGGITVNVDRDFSAGGYTYKLGLQQMNGKEALAYSRERHSFADGDNVRVKHQQDVLMAMLNKMMSPAVITNYSSVLKAISGCFETNMASSDITDLIKMQIMIMLHGHLNKNNLPEQELCKQVELTCLIANFII